MIVHGHAEVPAHDFLCRRSPVGKPGVDWGVSARAADWTCPACLRLCRLLERVHETAARFRYADDVRDLVDAVVPGRGIDALSDTEARRLLVVLNKVLVGAALRRERRAP
jgi:hypothetical protein